MKRKEIIELLWDESIRIDSIIWLAANSCDINHKLEEFLEFEEDEAERLLGKNPSSALDFEEYLSDLSRAGKNGYLVRVATPERRPEGYYTWGSCWCQWFYFEAWEEEAVAKTLQAWVETTRLNAGQAEDSDGSDKNAA